MVKPETLKPSWAELSTDTDWHENPTVVDCYAVFLRLESAAGD